MKDVLKLFIDLDNLLIEFSNSYQDPWYKGKLYSNKEHWESFLASKYVFEDSLEGIKYFYKSDGFQNYEDGYIKIYGILQALYLMQDAIMNFYRIIFGKKLDFKKMCPNSDKVRQLRNNISGHPYSDFNKEATYISRITIRKFSFDSIMYSPQDNEYSKETNHEKVNLKNLIELQMPESYQIILEITKKIESDIMEHKNKYKNIKLSSGFEMMGYYFSKSFELFFDYDEKTLGKNNFLMIKDLYHGKYNELEERLESLDFLEIFKENKIYLDYLIDRIDAHIKGTRKLDNKEGVIFLEALQSRMEVFVDSLKNLDEEY